MIDKDWKKYIKSLIVVNRTRKIWKSKTEQWVKSKERSFYISMKEFTAKESLDLAQNAYKQGAIPVIQLIDAQNNSLQAQLAKTTANYNYLITSMQLERAIGYFFLMHNQSENQDFIQRATQYILNKN